MFAFDLDPLLGKDDNEAKLYTSAHEKLLEVLNRFPISSSLAMPDRSLRL